jgi:C4-type Zn-finger protein
MIRRSDLDRDIIFSEHATIKFLELELEIPCQKGSINTIEGLLRKAYDGMTET